MDDKVAKSGISTRRLKEKISTSFNSRQPEKTKPPKNQIDKKETKIIGL